MKLSARNVFKGKVLEVLAGPINSRVKVDIGAGNVVTSIVTAGAVEDLGHQHRRRGAGGDQIQ